MILVIIVVFVFLQGWRATLIPIIAVPVSLIGTFAFFPLLGFSINPIALMGMVVAIGLVVDDAIVVVEAVQRHIEEGMPPREATLKAMDEVAGPVVAIGLVLAAVFLPTVFIPGITGRLYTQFAVTIAISVLLSAFNALTLSPALCSILLRPKKETRGPLGWFYRWFNRIFRRTTEGYVSVSGAVIRKAVIGFVILAVMTAGILLLGKRIPGGFLPEEDQGYVYAVIQLPDAASLQRTVGGKPAGGAHHHEHPRGGVLYHGRRLQPPERRAQYLQRLLLHPAQRMVRAEEPGRKGVRHHRPAQPRPRPSAAGQRLRLFPAGHPGRRHGGRGDVHPRRPLRQGYRVSWPRTPRYSSPPPGSARNWRA